MLNNAKAVNNNKEIRNKLNLFFNNYFGTLVFVLTIILLCLGFIYIIKPRNERVISNSQKALVEKQSYINLLNSALDKLIAYRASYDGISQDEKEKIDKILPGPEGKENIFSNLEAFVLRQGLTLDSLEIRIEDLSVVNSRQRQVEDADMYIDEAGAENIEDVNVKNADEPEKINLVIMISGINNYERFKDFLIALEKNMRLIDTTNIKYDQSAGTLSLEATSYYLSE